MQIDTIIFDLDGTLIDSAESIISSINVAFRNVGVEQKIPMNPSLIGPPLEKIMRSLVKDADAKAVPDLIDFFKKYYDEVGYKETIAYEGVLSALTELNNYGLKMYIATNKRRQITNKILDGLGWMSLFADVFSLDYFNPPMQDKESMLRSVNTILPARSAKRVYVGDRSEDADAARMNHLFFFWAKWGYGHLNDPIEYGSVLNRPDELKSILLYS